MNHYKNIILSFLRFWAGYLDSHFCGGLTGGVTGVRISAAAPITPHFKFLSGKGEEMVKKVAK
ncbi:MAG: hypothetical protein JSW01_05590 [Candidatus Bathyarchaeota archaeon]|nr:MAG: hypothetical protein JSW01_05590 [Candidatus Bathyarchaeota archaeon]